MATAGTTVTMRVFTFIWVIGAEMIAQTVRTVSRDGRKIRCGVEKRRYSNARLVP